jgi:hypothetical protein
MNREPGESLLENVPLERPRDALGPEGVADLVGGEGLVEFEPTRRKMGDLLGGASGPNAHG